MTSIKILQGIEIFNGLAYYELESISRLATEEKYTVQQMIFEEGTPTRKLYVVAEGTVEIKKWINNKSKQMVVDTVTPGKIFGWSALTKPPILTASAWVTKPTRLIAFSGDKLRDLFEKNTRIGYVVMSNLACVISQRLRHISEHLLKYSVRQKKSTDQE